MFKLSEKGAVPVLVLVFLLGVVVFVMFSSSADFKNKLFAQLYPKPVSRAVSEPISSPTPPSDTTVPTVNITNPVNGSTVKKGSTVNITANASDNVAVSRVEFYIAGNIRCLDAAAPYTCSWNVPKQPRVTYNITAKAYDSSGNAGSNSVNVTSK